MLSLDDGLIEALGWFARLEGRYWKHRLRTVWVRGDEHRLPAKYSANLRRARNVLGSKGLDKVRPWMLARVLP